MTQQVSVVLRDTSSNTTSSSVVGIGATESSPMAAPVSRTIPPFIDRGQAYYWTYAWQIGERESRSELAGGLGKTFENAEDAIRWLLSGDE
jgi:hypothetical protein